MTGLAIFAWVIVALLALGLIIAVSTVIIGFILEKRERARQTAVEMDRKRERSRKRILERQEAKPLRVAKAQQKLWKKYGHQALLGFTNNNAPLADALSHSDDIMKNPTIYNKMKHLAKLDNRKTEWDKRTPSEAQNVELFRLLPNNPSEDQPSEQRQPSKRKSVIAKEKQQEAEKKDRKQWKEKNRKKMLLDCEGLKC